LVLESHLLLVHVSLCRTQGTHHPHPQTRRLLLRHDPGLGHDLGRLLLRTQTLEILLGVLRECPSELVPILEAELGLGLRELLLLLREGELLVPGRDSVLLLGVNGIQILNGSKGR
jgi:hypothetical protein